MKKFLLTSVLFLSIFLLFSCDSKRDDNGDLLIGVQYPDTPTDPTASVRRLAEMNVHSLSFEDEWEDNHLKFNYSGEKLVSYTDVGSGETINIDYNTSNKISKVYSDGFTSTFTYSDNNVTQIVTEMLGMYNITADYTYSSSGLSKTVTVMELTVPFPLKVYMETSYVYTGSNITKATVKSGIYDEHGDLQLGDTPVVATYTYDARKSPYKLLPTEFMVYLAGLAPQGAGYLSTNNVTKYEYTDEDGELHTSVFQNQYNAADYLVKSVSGEEFSIFIYN